VRDLDLVRGDAWPRVLAVLADDPELRATVVEPVRAMLADGRRVDLTSYTAWWLRGHARLDGHPPTSCVAAGAAELAGLYDVVRSDLDDGFLTAIGVRTSLTALLADPDGPDDLLDRLADPNRSVGSGQLAALYAALAAVDPERVSPPSAVRVAPGTVVPAADAVVVDAPYHLQLPWPVQPLVVPLSVAGPLADVLDVATSSDQAPRAVTAGGVKQPVPDAVRQVLAGAADQWTAHDELVVAGHDVDWWVDPGGSVHACTMDGLARGLAWAAGRWDLRLVVAAALADPGQVDQLQAETRLET